MKPKKCKACGETFDPQRSMQQACSVPCAIDLANKAKAKAVKVKAQKEARETREKLKAMTTLPQAKKAAQTAFNAFVRARDKGKPCISCGKPLGDTPNSYDCGHYRSVGSAPHLRFDEQNAHGQCKHCNQYLAGNVVNYRKGLIERIGLAAVERLESDQTLRKHTKDELQDMAKAYRAKARQ
jgi:hypothetical protein